MPRWMSKLKMRQGKLPNLMKAWVPKLTTNTRAGTTCQHTITFNSHLSSWKTRGWCVPSSMRDNNSRVCHHSGEVSFWLGCSHVNWIRQIPKCDFGCTRTGSVFYKNRDSLLKVPFFPQLKCRTQLGEKSARPNKERNKNLRR